ncbi:hemerythrin HHE cation binding domain-containing protein [Nonomuraea fuscirosea]|uniref:Hemerythrin HHE cation binding domain-containing protein n=2 Tax=Nonomuraea fuscirosea TaxID=1291556 RepID=A0A2T0MQI9_9ACTN|nr:hemerythrin HHE cation binding domain-containing protein [Nonomuraea fuscirosea]
MNQPMADVRDMFMVHTMMRREFGLLPQLVREVTAGDTHRSTVVGRHAALMCVVLHLHHEGEDLILWPLLLERGGAQASIFVPKVEDQHHGIEAALEEVKELLPAWTATAHNGERLAEAFEVLRDRLQEHMAVEEEEILPLAAKVVTAAEWAQLGEHSLSNSPKKDLPLVFGMGMYEGDPDVVKEVLSHAPPAARLIMPLLAPRLYARHAKRLYGTATPPRAGRL